MKELKLLGDRIKQLRSFKKIPREKFAIETELARSYLYRIEEGAANPSVKALLRIAKELDVKVKDLLDF